MNEFTASNGVKVRSNESGIYVAGPGLTGTRIFPNDVRALREFFQHERDEELARWRDRRYPDHVVYPAARTPQVAGRGVQVLDERTGRLYDRWEAPTAFNEWDSSPRELAARAYFESHPEFELPDEPRTAWVDKYGTDVWVVHPDGVLRCVFSPSSDPRKYAPFTRLLPEESS